MKARYALNCVYLLLMGAALHYGFDLFPPSQQADIWNIVGAFTRIALLVSLLMYRSGVILLVGLWWVCEEMLVIGCSTVWIISPWERVIGQPQCSGLFHHDIGKIGILAVSILARHPDNLDRVRNR
jgi:hypothetical protein